MQTFTAIEQKVMVWLMAIAFYYSTGNSVQAVLMNDLKKTQAD